jgi:cysteinyl-tRNA synthetase
MSKSLGNLITVKEALERYSADAIRLFVISSHYRSPLTYSEEGLAAAERGVERLRLAARRGGEEGGPSDIEVALYRQRFTDAMDDDFNTAQALSILFDLAREINSAADEGHSVEEAQKEMIELVGILGLILKEEMIPLDAEPFIRLAEMHNIAVEIECEVEDETQRAISCIDLLVEKRDELRLKRQWDLADKIRAELVELGIVLEDTPQGTVWRYRR